MSVVDAILAAVLEDDEALDRLAAALRPRLAASTTAAPLALTTAQAARHAGLHERTIRRALAAQTLVGHVVAGRWRVEPDALSAWLDAGAPTSATPTHGNARPLRSASAGVAAIAGRSAP